MKTALVTGANRGIGFSICELLFKQYHFDKVYLGCRNLEKGKEAAEKLSKYGIAVPIQIDISEENSIQNAYNTYKNIRLKDEKLTVLVNNAAVNLDWIPNKWYPNAFEIPTSDIEKIFRVNMLGAFLVTKYFRDEIADYGSVVNVGTGSMELATPTAEGHEYPFYGAAKIALYMLTKKMGAVLKERNISVNMACPGWCKTEMGGDLACDGPEVGADSILRAAFIGKKDKPTGKFMRYGQIIPIDSYDPKLLPKRKKQYLKKLLKIFRMIRIIYIHSA